MEEGVVVGDDLLLVVHGAPHAVVAHRRLVVRRQALALVRQHQLVHRSVVRGAEAEGGGAEEAGEEVSWIPCVIHIQTDRQTDRHVRGSTLKTLKASAHPRRFCYFSLISISHIFAKLSYLT